VTKLELGPVGVATGLDSSLYSLTAARLVEELGFPTLWLAGGPLPGLQTLVDIVSATRSVRVISGILAVDRFTPEDVTATYQRIEAEWPGRFVVGLGGAHGARPLATLNRFLDQLDAVPQEARVLAAIGPRMLELARDRTAGAYPFLINSAYTAEARDVLGDGAALAVQQLVVLEDDPSRAREIARESLGFLSKLPGYAASLSRMGFSADQIGRLDDRLVDALTAWGSPAAIAERVEEQREAGADHVAINVLTGVTGPQPVDQWRALAPVLL
jgi:probable F420-dependent oxidoreductase